MLSCGMHTGKKQHKSTLEPVPATATTSTNSSGFLASQYRFIRMTVSTLTSGHSPLRRRPLHPSAPLHRRFKGVRQRGGGRWVSDIRIPHSRDKVWLGSFPTAEHAARAYDTAYLLLRRPNSSSFLNFSDSLLLITPRLAEYTSGHVLTNRTIQKAAAAIANTIAAEAHNLSTAQLPANVASREPPMMTSLQGFDSEEYRWITDLMSPLGSPREKAGSRSSSFLSLKAESPSLFSAAAASFDQLHQGVQSYRCSKGDQQLTAGSCHAAIHDHQHELQEGLQGVRSSICSSADQTDLVAGNCKIAANNNRQQGLRAEGAGLSSSTICVCTSLDAQLMPGSWGSAGDDLIQQALQEGLQGRGSSSCGICVCAKLDQQLAAGSWNGRAARDDLIQQAMLEGLGSSSRVQGALDLHMSLEYEQLMSASCYCEEAASLQGFDSEEYRWITDLMSPLGSPREKAGSHSSNFVSVTAETPSLFSAAAASFDQLHQGVQSSRCSNGDQQPTAGSCHAAIHDHQHGLQEGLQGVRSSICRSVDQTHLAAASCKAAANNNRQQGLREEGAGSSSCRIYACTSVGQQLTAERWNGGAAARDDLIQQALQEGLGSSRRVQGAQDLHMSLELYEQLMSASYYCEEAYSLQEGLLKDGFTAMSPAVTIRWRFDVDVTWDTHNIAPLWIYPC